MQIAPYTGPLARELEVAIEAAQLAASTVLRYYHDQSADLYTKGDGSPLTDADLAADRIIREILTRAFRDDALLTEESAGTPGRQSNPRCWIVDPIDGTAEFVNRTGEFDVLIALAVQGRPVVGVACQPVTGTLWAAVAGRGAWEIAGGDVVPFRFGPAHTPPRLLTSKWYGGNDPVRIAAMARIARALDTDPPHSVEVGFQARIFAEQVRSWDAYIGLPQLDMGSAANEWDFAAVDLITHEAGGRFTDCWGRLHRYNKRSTQTSGGILASSEGQLHERLLVAIADELPITVPPADPADNPATV